MLGKKIVFPNTPENAKSVPVKYNHILMDKIYDVVGYSDYPAAGQGPQIVYESGELGDVPMNEAQWVFAEDYFKCPVTKPHIPSAERPPLGLRPKYIVDACRMKEILEAITRYVEAGKKIPDAWLDEFDELNNCIGE